MAQSVEQFTRNEQVIGSNPITSSIKKLPSHYGAGVNREKERFLYMNKKATSIVSYCTILGWLVAFLAGDKENSKFHLNQGLVLGIFSTGISVIFSVIGGILGGISSFGGLIGWIFGVLAVIVNIVSTLVGILFVVLMVVGILNAVNDKEVALPVIGGIKILK